MLAELDVELEKMMLSDEDGHFALRNYELARWEVAANMDTLLEQLMTPAEKMRIRMSRDEMTAYDFAEAIKAYELGNRLGERVIRTR